MSVRLEQDEFDNFLNKSRQDDMSISIQRFTWKNAHNTTVQVITYGGIITSIKMPNREGQVEDIVTGFDNLDGYLNPLNPYFGCTVGRVANRIKNSQFTLNGVIYKLKSNSPDSPHQLHGGPKGFDKAIWEYYVKGTKLILSHMSPDDDQGFPGHCLINATYELTDANEFKIDFIATTTKPTYVNLTNHSYFNLAGHNKGPLEIYNHKITINADKITEADDDSIPTGKLLSINGTIFDFTKSKLLGNFINKIPKTRGFDNNFCINRCCNKGNVFVAKIVHPTSGRVMEIYSNQPGVQFYTGNFLPDSTETQNVLKGKNNSFYCKHGALCLETQNYPNAINEANFPNAVLNPGETYNHSVSYKFYLN